MRKEFSAGIVIYRTEVHNALSRRLYLLLNYPRGYWDLAKGKLEPGETEKEAALRELKEETGLEARLDEGFKEELFYMFRDPQGALVDKKVTFFLGEARSSKVRLSYEHKDYSWLPYEEAVKQLSYLNARNLISAAEKFLGT